jgi:hypothetical protein
MSGYASHILEQYYADTHSAEIPEAIDQYQKTLLRYWIDHLEHVLTQHATEVLDKHTTDTIIREFLYGAAPHPQDALERQRLFKITQDALMKTAPRFLEDIGLPPVQPHTHRNDHTHPSA